MQHDDSQSTRDEDTSVRPLRAAVAGHLVAVLLAVVHVQYAPPCGASAYEAARAGPWRTCRCLVPVVSHSGLLTCRACKRARSIINVCPLVVLARCSLVSLHT